MSKIKNSLFLKLVLLLMLVIILPAVVSNIIAYLENYHMVRQQIIDWNDRMMEIGMESTIAYIRGVEQAPMNLFGNADAIRVLNKQEKFSDMDRYVIRKLGQSISERDSSIYRIVMSCKNGESIDGIYLNDQMSRTITGNYLYPEQTDSAFQIGTDEDGKPAALIFNMDIQNVPSYEIIVRMRIFAALDDLQDMTKVLCGQYEDSVVMVFLGEEKEQLLFSSEPYREISFREEDLLQKQYAKGTLDGEAGIFFQEKEVYKGTEICLVKFVDNHYFSDPAGRVVLIAAVVQICLLAVSAVFLFLAFNLLISPVKRMLNNMKAMEISPDFDYKSGTDRKDELGVLENQYEGMMKSLDELVNKNYRSQLETAKANFKMLQAQINPHFLYNMLQYISTTALKSHCPEVSRQLTQLGELFQYTMNTSEELVTLERELHHLENYMMLQEGRFGGRLHFTVHCPKQLGEIPVPKMILQPLVENCIKHGIDQKDGTGSIMVSITEKDGQCRIRVMDNGAGMSEEQMKGLRSAYDNYGFNASTESGIGFLNVLQRCKLYFRDGFEWDIRSIPGVETTVELVFQRERESE
ncbi:MAG: histidine kinase [Eubacteriales bacterium]|nr:histidine kinase [Eubacteriales bacterium]